MRWVLVCLFLLVLCPVALAQSGTIKLLALSENPDGSTSGTVASLSLELRPGTERVFLETIPLTRVATQISMRFAQQIACKEYDVECGDKDFVYTIVAQPGLVGGPSAGAAAAVLSASLLKGIPVRDDIAITGTINSGGVIGPVGGVKEKIEAAHEQGITTVLVPKGTRVFGKSNVSLDLQEWGRMNNVSVKEVATLDEALYAFTGVNVSRPLPPFVIDEAYQNRMRAVMQLMCKRTHALRNATTAFEDENAITRELADAARNNTARASQLSKNEAYYSAASYCFRANINLNRLGTVHYNESRKKVADRIRNAFFTIAKLQNETESRELRTLTDLQTFMSVEERILEAADMLVDASDAITDDLDEAQGIVSFAEERVASAKSWSAFFGLPGEAIIINQDTLRESCLSKLSEAEERFSYVRTFFPDALEETRRTLDRAHQDAQNVSYALCLGMASKAKAEADVVLSVTGFEPDQVKDLLALKLSVAQRVLAQAQRHGAFPLVGYNYYQYANDLKDEDEYSALLFAEYAIELSNLDIYFEKPRPWYAPFSELKEVSVGTLLLLSLGSAVLGMAVMLVLMRVQKGGRRKSRSAKTRT